MSAKLNYKNDLFISYAHIDNARFTEIEKGWIDLLHEALDWRLPQLMGGPVKIWRDRKLGGNDVFNDTIVIEADEPLLRTIHNSARQLHPGALRAAPDTRRQYFRLPAPPVTQREPIALLRRLPESSCASHPAAPQKLTLCPLKHRAG